MFTAQEIEATFALVARRDPERLSISLLIFMNSVESVETNHERLESVPERFSREAFVRESQPERKLIAIVFCETVPERLVKALVRVRRFPDSVPIDASRRESPPESVAILELLRLT